MAFLNPKYLNARIFFLSVAQTNVCSSARRYPGKYSYCKQAGKPV